MRVAQIGTMKYPIPNITGKEQSMAQMTAFQAAIRAHDVTLYASADSRIIEFTHQIARELGLSSEINQEGNIISVISANGQKGFVRLRTTGHNAGNSDKEKRNHELVQLLIADEKAHPLDIIHFHDYKHTPKYLISAGLGHKMLHHRHSERLNKEYENQRYPLICISHSQAKALQEKYDANVFAVIHHGMDKFTHHLTTRHAGYLGWVGRIDARKGAETAIKIAKAANQPLVIAGRVNSSKQVDYFKHDLEG